LAAAWTVIVEDLDEPVERSRAFVVVSIGELGCDPLSIGRPMAARSLALYSRFIRMA
jgi:hypothetical protein